MLTNSLQDQNAVDTKFQFILRQSCRIVDFEMFWVFSSKLQNTKLWYALNTFLSGDVPQQRFMPNAGENILFIAKNFLVRPMTIFTEEDELFVLDELFDWPR